MQLPTIFGPDGEESGLADLLTMPWLRHRWIIPTVVVTLCALVAVVWSTTRHSESSGPLVASDDAPTVAGEPSPSIVAAAEAATPYAQSDGGANADQVAAIPVPTPDAASSGSSDAAGDAAEPSATAGYGSSNGAPAPAADPPGGGAPYVAPSDGDPSTSPGPAPAPGSTPVPPPPPAPTRVFPVNQAQRLTTAQLVDLVDSNNITNVADFLSALPPYMGESFTLMEETRSRHQASIEYPRLIMYGPDARILLGVSSHPLDPLREVVEVAELDEATGLWRFSQFDFRAAFVHDTNTESCAGCHGSPLRPIWGEYPNWPGAFAGQDERLSGGQAAALMDIKYNPFDRFHHLVFPSDHSIQNNGQLYLPSRQYGYANTSFNFELNAAVADGIARRIINHPNWASEGYRLLAVQWGCGGNAGAAGIDALYNRFGVDGNNDFQLESPVFEAQAGQRDEYDWNQGSTGLDDSVAFRTLDLAAQRDPGLDAVVSADQLFVDFSNYWFNTLGAERSEFLRVNGIYETDFRPQNLSGAFVGRVCNYLATNGASR
ncbi:MAG: hypothetical protein ACR2QO_24695 [Acidimicrobiales bacterium]